MFWGKESVKEEAKKEKLPGPQAIPGLVQKHLVAERQMDPVFVRLLKAVVLKSATQETGLNIRVFDDTEALGKKVEVKDYTSLDEHPDLIIYDGWFDEGSKQVKLEEKKRVTSDTTIFTEAEILQKIEALKEPGSTVFFYMASGGSHGGPLGIGAAVIELNPDYPGKHHDFQTCITLDPPEESGDWILWPPDRWDGITLVRDRKSGFCLADHWGAAPGVWPVTSNWILSIPRTAAPSRSPPG